MCMFWRFHVYVLEISIMCSPTPSTWDFWKIHIKTYTKAEVLSVFLNLFVLISPMCSYTLNPRSLENSSKRLSHILMHTVLRERECACVSVGVKADCIYYSQQMYILLQHRLLIAYITATQALAHSYAMLQIIFTIYFA